MSIVWSENDENIKNMLYGKIKKLFDANIDESNYIDENIDKLPKIIENSSYSESSKERIFFMIAKYLKIYGLNNDALKYSALGYKYKQLKREYESQNIQTEKEKANYRSHQYLINILNSINYNEIQTFNEHQKYILLSLLILQPPLRTSFYISCKFITSDSQNNGVNNFIKFERNKEIYYIVNSDKVSNTNQYKDGKNSEIKIENANLCELLRDSYKRFHRVYLFENEFKQPITQPTLLNWLRDITQTEHITLDIIRSSYINFYYENNKSLQNKEKLSKEMRHSVATQALNYFKVDADEPPPPPPPQEPQPEIINIVSPNEETPIKKQNDPKFNKHKRDVIYNLNKGSKPRESTLKKYNITFDKTTNKYK